MTSFHEKLNDWFFPVALGAMVYFLQSIAHDNNELAKNMAVMTRHQDDFEAVMARRQTEYERRLGIIETKRNATRSGSR